MNTELHEKLNTLQQLIEQERCCAVSLDVSELKSIQEEKGALLSELRALQDNCPDELKEMASHLRDKNRRNARLLHSTLTFFRQMMSDCLKEVSPLLYGQRGQKIRLQDTGVLHAGRI